MAATNRGRSSNTEQAVRTYDRLPWKRQAAYRLHRFRDWKWPDESGALTVGGDFKTADDGAVANKLAFFSLDEAGHAAPGDQKEAVSWLVECWIDKQGADVRCPV